MNKILTNLSQARNNPHVFWPLLAAVLIRVIPSLLFKAMDIYAPQLVGKDAMMQDILEPYIRDAVQALTAYGSVAAANSGPTPPPQDPPKA